jgi:carbonic anhydrase
MISKLAHPAACACCGDLLRGAFSRRRFIAGAAAGGAMLALPSLALAAEGQYDAMVLSCIDPRVQDPVHQFMGRRKLTGKFSQFVVAGAAIGVVAPSFKDWQKTFWDNLATSVQLHRIQRIIAIDHRDCGAAKIAYGDAAVAKRDAETETHRKALAEFRKQVGERQPGLAVETGLMALDGWVEIFA